MKLLSKILGPKLFKRFALWYYKNFGGPKFESSAAYQSLVILRAAEYDGPHRNQVSGDSVAAGGESWFELIYDTKCTAIPGERTDSFLSRIDSTVLIYKPEAVVLHLGGNDILAGIDLDMILSNLAKIHKNLRENGVKRIGWFEILPLGAQFADAHKTAAELTQIVKTQLAYDVLDIRSGLAGPDGFIAAKYAGDGIHCNTLAYNDVFYPVAAKYIRGKA